MKKLNRCLRIFLVLGLMFGLVKPVMAAEKPDFRIVTDVLDSGQVVSGVLVDMKQDVKNDDFDKGSFVVHAKHLYDKTAFVDKDLKILNAYVVKDESGEKADTGHFIMLETEKNGTLYWDNPNFSNIPMTLDYQVTQVKALDSLEQVKVVLDAKDPINHLVDGFEAKTSKSKLNYRMFTPAEDDHKNALVVWLHGAGEGGDNNITPITANRGGLGFATPEHQDIFDGAYVIAPQSPNFWMDELKLGDLVLKGGNYTDAIISLIEEEIDNNDDIDAGRIYIGGCSMGGYQTWKTILAKPEMFAAAFPVCAAYAPTEEELKTVVDLPIWLTHAKVDDTVPVTNSQNTYKMLKDLGGKVVYTEYPDVTFGGQTYPPHWSWIYVANNDPVFEDVHIMNWLNEQHIEVKESSNTTIYIIAGVVIIAGGLWFYNKKKKAS